MTRSLIVAAALWACACDSWDRALERMVDQPRVDTWEPSPVFADGLGMRTPPEGTVARNRQLDPTLDPTLPERGPGEPGDPLTGEIPIALTRAVLDRGRDRFGIFCAPCHGLTGDGQSVVAMHMSLRRPPDIVPYVEQLTPAELYVVVRNGYGLMPGYAAQLSIDDRWAVVAYLRALQRSRSVPIVSLPEPVRQEALRELR